MRAHRTAPFWRRRSPWPAWSARAAAGRASRRSFAPAGPARPRLRRRIPSGLIVFDGDSLTEGYLLAPSQSYPSQAMKQLPDWLEYVNVGIAGQTWQDLLRGVRREVDPLYSAARRLNLVVAWAAANDLASGFTARETYENARRYCEARRRVGFTVVTATMYPLQPKDVDAALRGAQDRLQRPPARPLARVRRCARRPGRRRAHRRPVRPRPPAVLHRRRAPQRGRLRRDRRLRGAHAAPHRGARRAVGRGRAAAATHVRAGPSPRRRLRRPAGPAAARAAARCSWGDVPRMVNRAIGTPASSSSPLTHRPTCSPEVKDSPMARPDGGHVDARPARAWASAWRPWAAMAMHALLHQRRQVHRRDLAGQHVGEVRGDDGAEHGDAEHAARLPHGVGGGRRHAGATAAARCS